MGRPAKDYSEMRSEIMHLRVTKQVRMLFLVNRNRNDVNQLEHKVNAAHQTGMANENAYISILAGLEGNNKFMSSFINDAD